MTGIGYLANQKTLSGLLKENQAEGYFLDLLKGIVVKSTL